MNRVDAKHIIGEYVTTTWLATCASLGITGTEVLFKDDRRPEPANGKYWMRLTTAVVDERQETLRNGVNGVEVRRFVTVGIATVQVFGPKSDDNAPDNVDLLAEAMRNAFRNPLVDDNLEFTQAAIDDNIPAEPAWVKVNIGARFWYRQFM